MGHRESDRPAANIGQGASCEHLLLCQLRNEITGPGELAGLEQASHEACLAVLGKNSVDQGLVGLRGSRGESEGATSPSPSSNRRLPRRDWQ